MKIGYELVSKMHFLWEILRKIFAGSFRVSLFIELIWGSHEIWGKGGGDTLALL